MSAYEEGYLAHVTDELNPYEPGSDEHDLWQEGKGGAEFQEDEEVCDNL